MITHIRVKNFKSWQDSDEVKLAPSTGFFGTNSSSKNNLLQMLLLLNQTVRQTNILENSNGSEKNKKDTSSFRSRLL